MHVEVEVYFFLFPGNYDNVSIGELAVQIFIQWIYELQGSCRVLDIWQKRMSELLYTITTLKDSTGLFFLVINKSTPEHFVSFM